MLSPTRVDSFFPNHTRRVPIPGLVNVGPVTSPVPVPAPRWTYDTLRDWRSLALHLSVNVRLVHFSPSSFSECYFSSRIGAGTGFLSLPSPGLLLLLSPHRDSFLFHDHNLLLTSLSFGFALPSTGRGVLFFLIACLTAHISLRTTLQFYSFEMFGMADLCAGYTLSIDSDVSVIFLLGTLRRGCLVATNRPLSPELTAGPLNLLCA